MTARTFAGANQPVYVWQFGYVPPAGRERSPYGAGHGSELSFVFNTLHARWGAQGEPTASEKELANLMNSYWVNFAKTGNPNGNNLPAWPQYDIQKAEILDISLDGEVTNRPDPRKARFDVLEKAFENRTRLQTRKGF
jgi:para-nitrobenzyl esterase